MATAKKTARVRFAKGITISKDYQSVRYEIGIEMDFEVDASGNGLRAAIALLERKVNRELRRRKDRSLHQLNGDL